jgi:hypothetical protein
MNAISARGYGNIGTIIYQDFSIAGPGDFDGAPSQLK